MRSDINNMYVWLYFSSPCPGINLSLISRLTLCDYFSYYNKLPCLKLGLLNLKKKCDFFCSIWLTHSGYISTAKINEIEN